MWWPVLKVSYRLAAIGGGLYGWSSARSAIKRLPKNSFLQKRIGKPLKGVEIAFAVIAVAGIIALFMDND